MVSLGFVGPMQLIHMNTHTLKLTPRDNTPIDINMDASRSCFCIEFDSLSLRTWRGQGDLKLKEAIFHLIFIESEAMSQLIDKATDSLNPPMDRPQFFSPYLSISWLYFLKDSGERQRNWMGGIGGGNDKQQKEPVKPRMKCVPCCIMAHSVQFNAP